MDYEQFVPGISVTIGLLLAVANLGVLIYFIHYVAVSIQASHVVQSVTAELRATIDRLWPDKLGHEVPQSHVPKPPMFREEESAAIVSAASGYVDAINEETLMTVRPCH
jgi:uncharacterized membrane protein